MVLSRAERVFRRMLGAGSHRKRKVLCIFSCFPNEIFVLVGLEEWMQYMQSQLGI